jgi:ABC-type transport system substrate-binding protein
MEASKEGEMPSETAPETLPTEIKEERKKFPMMLAVIIVIILVIAALGAAFGLGLFNKKKETTNLAPTAGARADVTTIPIGGTVHFTSLASDPDGSIAKYWWYFGDGTNTSGDASVAKNVSHTYAYAGHYLVLHVATDDGGLNGSNEAAMIGVDVLLYTIPDAPNTNTTAPFAILTSDKSIIEPNHTVNFNMTSTTAVKWIDANASWEQSYNYLSGTTLDYGVGAAAVSVAPGPIMTGSHNYTASGHYAVKFTATAWNGVSTTVINTVHVLSPAATSTVPIKNPDAFIMATIGEPQYLDPAVDYESAGGEILQNTYETLIWYSGSSASALVPQLATAVPTVGNGITADGLYYNFTLKSTVKFHNNVTMTADDVAYSAQRAIRIHDPDGPAWMIEQVLTDSLSAYIGDELQNFTATSHPAWLLATIGGTNPHYIITELDNQNASEAAITAVDSTHVSFHLTHAYPGFLYICAYTVMDVVSKTFVEAHGGVVNGQQNDDMNLLECGTGPYYMVKWDKGVQIHLSRWTGYWGPAPALKDVYIVKANDQNTRLLMLQAGDADSAVIPIEFESLFSGSSFRVVKGLPTFDVTFAGFNMNINTTEAASFGSNVPANFFTDAHVRAAFVHLLNYTQFITNVLKGNAIVPERHAWSVVVGQGLHDSLHVQHRQRLQRGRVHVHKAGS